MPGATLTRAQLDTVLVQNIGLEADEIAADNQATLADLGVDSIGIIELQKVLHDEYQIDLPDELHGLTVDEVLAQANADSAEG